MGPGKTRSLRHIEERMAQIEEHTVRHQVLERAKQFKTSWLDLAQLLSTVWRDKLYKEWGYVEFETYTLKEIGIRKDTAMKLLRSYRFLEDEEPSYIRKEAVAPEGVAAIPQYESVYVLRGAKAKKTVDPEGYAQLKQAVLAEGKDVREVRKDLVSLMRQREEADPEETLKQRRILVLKRLIGTLQALKRELMAGRLLPKPVLDDIDAVLTRVSGACSDAD